MMMEFSNWGWLGMIFMIAFWGLVIWGIIWMARYLAQSDSTPKDQISALELLKRRYAAGEIGREEFETKKRELI